MVNFVRPLGRVGHPRIVQQEPIGNVDTLDEEYAVLLFDLAFDIGDQTIIACWYLARFQRASKSTGQSAAGGRDDVVECGSCGRLDVGPVVLRDFGVDTEVDGVFGRRKIGVAERALLPFDPDARRVQGHGGSSNRGRGGSLQ